MKRKVRCHFGESCLGIGENLTVTPLYKITSLCVLFFCTYFYFPCPLTKYLKLILFPSGIWKCNSTGLSQGAWFMLQNIFRWNEVRPKENYMLVFD